MVKVCSLLQYKLYIYLFVHGSSIYPYIAVYLGHFYFTFEWIRSMADLSIYLYTIYIDLYINKNGIYVKNENILKENKLHIFFFHFLSDFCNVLHTSFFAIEWISKWKLKPNYKLWMKKKAIPLRWMKQE